MQKYDSVFAPCCQYYNQLQVMIAATELSCFNEEVDSYVHNDILILNIPVKVPFNVVNEICAEKYLQKNQEFFDSRHHKN